MLYIPKIDEYLKTLTDEEVKDLVAINFSEYFKSTKEKLYSNCILNMSLKQLDGVEKYVQSSSSDNYIHLYNVEILNLFDSELEHQDTESVIKKELKSFSVKFKKCKVQTVLVLGLKKRNDCKIFHPCTKLIASNSDIDKAFKSMYQSIMTKIKNYFCKDWIVLDKIVKYSMKMSLSIRRKNGDNK